MQTPPWLQIDPDDTCWIAPWHVEEGPGCLCSRCLSPICPPDVALRCYGMGGWASYRYHARCLGVPHEVEAMLDADVITVRQLPREDELPPLDAGPCCVCEALGSEVRHGIMLPYENPPEIEGGWGCGACGLPAHGAMAIVCDRCLGALLSGAVQLQWLCAPEQERVPWRPGLPPFEHNPARHPLEKPWIT